MTSFPVRGSRVFNRQSHRFRLRHLWCVCVFDLCALDNAALCFADTPLPRAVPAGEGTAAAPPASSTPVSVAEPWAPSPFPPAPPLAGPTIAASRGALAEQRFRQGRAAMEAGRYDAACIEFAESQRLDPGLGTLLNLALCHEKQGRVASAWAEFVEAKGLALQQQRRDREAFAQTHITALEPQLPRLSVVGVQPDAVVTMDGTVVGRGTALAARMPVDPGAHEIRVTAPGAKAWTAHVQLELGRAQTLRVPALQRLTIPSAPTLTPGIVLGGTSAVSLALGFGFGAAAMVAKSSADQSCPNNACTAEGWAAQQRYERQAAVSTIAVGVGVAGAVATGVWYWRYRRAQKAHMRGLSQARAGTGFPAPWQLPVVAAAPGELHLTWNYAF